MTKSFFTGMSGASLLALIGSNGPAQAQTSSDVAGSQVEQVVVTGSRIPRSQDTHPAGRFDRS